MVKNRSLSHLGSDQYRVVTRHQDRHQNRITISKTCYASSRT